MYKRNSIRLKADFSSETLDARRQWENILKVLKGKKKRATRNFISGKIILQELRRNQDIFRLAKTERVCR